MSSSSSSSFSSSLPPDAPSTTTTLFLVSALTGLTLIFLYHGPILRWLKLKRYQYEVTFSLYMLTPTEKFVFNSILFLFLSMIIIAASLYLPEHITTVANRAWYYVWGDEGEGKEKLLGYGAAVAETASQSTDAL